MVEGTTGERVGDEVWEQIAHRAQPGPEERRMFRRSAAGVLVALLCGVALWASGLFSPVLSHGDSSGGSADSSARTATYEFDLANHGILPATVVGSGADVPGLRVVSTSPARVRLAPGASAHLRLALEVEDCPSALRAVATRDSFDGPPIEVRVSRPWGTVVGRVHSPGGSWLADLLPLACGVEPAG
jgi:hypothetical protein